MSSRLSGATVAVLGGDDRELFLVPELVRLGANVRVAGISKLAGHEKIQCFGKVEEAVQGARFVILPMPGIDEQGRIRAKYATHPLILDETVLRSFSDDCTVIVGAARPLLKNLAAQRGLNLIEIAELDEIAILNSIPSAEGAIQMAMEHTDITIHGSNSIVLGYGRCGMTLARMLAGLCARVSVVARKPKDLARIREMGCTPLTWEQFADNVSEADLIFNTVPLLVLNQPLLEKTKLSVYICDIASSPGGVDFAAAEELGRKAHLAPGLPGKVAPRTAGMILAEVIPDLIARELAHTSSSTLESECMSKTEGLSGVLECN